METDIVFSAEPEELEEEEVLEALELVEEGQWLLSCVSFSRHCRPSAARPTNCRKTTRSVLKRSKARVSVSIFSVLIHPPFLIASCCLLSIVLDY